MLMPASGPLDNHLRDTVATEGLATHERLALDTRQRIADRSEQQEDGRCQERRWRGPDTAQELDDGHDEIGGGAHVVGRDLANEGVELARGRADAQEEGNFDEQYQECGSDGEGTHDGWEQAEAKERADTCRKTDDHRQEAEPLSVDTEVASPQLVRDRHVGGLLTSPVFRLGGLVSSLRAHRRGCPAVSVGW